MPLSGDRVARRVRFRIAVVTDDAANPFNLASQDCMATYVFSKDGAPLGGHGYCDGISAAGEKRGRDPISRGNRVPSPFLLRPLSYSILLLRHPAPQVGDL
jgi:hypothetical protein